MFLNAASCSEWLPRPLSVVFSNICAALLRSADLDVRHDRAFGYDYLSGK
jgi:hypothetical protein